MLQVNYLPYDDYRGESTCDILCDVCGDRLLGANCMMDICDVRVLREIKSACGWKSIRHPARGWMDICPACCKNHPELCFRRASAEEDFADIVYPK